MSLTRPQLVKRHTGSRKAAPTLEKQLSLLPPLSSFDLETVSNPRDPFFKAALMIQVLGFWDSQPDEKLLSQDQQSTKFKCKLLNFFLGKN